jgi:Predicted glycosyltransferases
MQPEISIITVTMNHLSLLKDLLETLFVSAKPVVSFELIIVDNCSTDGTSSYIKEHYPSVTIIDNKSKQGFAKNNNDGAKIASGKYLLILNPDIKLRPKAIDNLYEYLKNDKTVGIVAPQLLNTDLSTQYSARNFMSLKLLLIRIFTKGKDDVNNKTVNTYLLRDISGTEPVEVDWCMGAALLLEKKFYFQLNGFDEKFFLYVEDADLCHRCWLANKKVVYLPSAKMIHQHQRSSRDFNKKTWLHLKSMFYFFRKNKFTIKRHQ